MTGTLSALVLATGDDGGMRSTRPKSLHRLCGRPMVSWVLAAVGSRPLDRAVVVARDADRVVKTVAATSHGLVPDVVEAGRGPGSGAAAEVGLTAFASEELDDETADIIVAPADVPLLRPETVAGLAEAHRSDGADATLLCVARQDAPRGRAVRRGRDGRAVEVLDPALAVDADDLDPEISATEVLIVRRSLLGPALRRAGATGGVTEVVDIVGVLHGAGYRVECHHAGSGNDLRSVHDRVELAAAEVELRARINRRWMEAGVTMLDPASTYVDATVELAPDVTLFPSTMLQGSTAVAEGAEIGMATRLVDTRVGARARVDRTTAVGATIGADTVVGPFAALAPGDAVAAGERPGPFLGGGSWPG